VKAAAAARAALEARGESKGQGPNKQSSGEEVLYDAFKGKLPGQEDEVSALGYILVVMASNLDGCSIDRSTLWAGRDAV
jgi:hypothetical protein